MVQYILSILEIFSQNWSYEAMFSYLKSGWIKQIEQEEIFQLENYCRKWGIKGSKWYQADWNYGMDPKEEGKITRLNEIRRQIVEPLLRWKEKMEQGRNVTTISKTLYTFLIENEIPEKLEEKIETLEQANRLDLAKEYQGSFERMIEVLEDMTMVFAEKKVTYERYAELLKVGLKNSSLGKIPESQDQVILGDVERSRTHRVKAVFIIGLNDGQFPSVRKEEGFFNDQDREVLKEKGIELAKGTLENLYEDNFNIYKAFSSAEERLLLSYSSADSEGKSLRGSVLLSRIKKMFPNLKEKSDVVSQQEEIISESSTFQSLLTELNACQEGKEIDPIWFSVYQYYQKQEDWKPKLEESMKALHFTNLPEQIDQEKVEKLYGKTLKTSVSQLEQYRKCAFSFYLKYGLKLSEQENYEIRRMDTGTFMHEVIDCFFEKLTDQNISIRQITQEQLEELIEEILQEKLNLKKNYIFTSNAKFRNLTRRLKKVIKKSLQYMIESLQESQFEVYATELEFKNGKDYPAICMQLEDGRKIEITGKIDRVDLAKTEEGKYLRIIDYKSSIKNIDLNEVIAGMQLQLLTYLDAISEKIEDVIPAGVLYFSLLDPIIKADKNKTEEEIEQEMKKRFKMNGLILADTKVIKMMDTKLESGASLLVPAYIDKSGNLSKSKSSA